MNLREMAEEKVDLQIAPLIDVVFLLLIFFMVSATLLKKEADMSISLPAQVEQTDPLDMPDEAVIEIWSEGQIVMNNRIYSQEDERFLPALEDTLSLYKEASKSLGQDAVVTIQPADQALHKRIIDVLNACAGADIKNISFTMEE